MRGARDLGEVEADAAGVAEVVANVGLGSVYFGQQDGVAGRLKGRTLCQAMVALSTSYSQRPMTRPRSMMAWSGRSGTWRRSAGAGDGAGEVGRVEQAG